MSRLEQLTAFTPKYILGSAATRDASWIFAERLANSLLNFSIIIMVARLLGPEQYGYYALAVTFLAITLAIGQLGIDSLLIKLLVERKYADGRVLGTVYYIKLAVYAPIIVITMLFVWQYSSLVDEERIIISILMLIVGVSPLLTSLQAWLNAQKLFRQQAARRIQIALLFTVSKVAVILMNYGIIQVTIVHALSFLAEAIYLFFLGVRHGLIAPLKWEIDWDVLRALLGQSLFLFAGSLFAMFFINADVLTLRILQEPRDVGAYAIVPQILLSAQLLPYAITSAIFPSLVATLDTQPLLFKRKALIVGAAVAIAGLFACFALFLLAAPVTTALFGGRYSGSITPLMIGSLALPFIFYRQFSTKMVVCLDLGRQFAVAEALVLAIAVAAYYGLTLEFSVIGTAWAMVLVFASEFLLLNIILFVGMREFYSEH